MSCLGSDFVLFSNFELDDKLKALLQVCCLVPPAPRTPTPPLPLRCPSAAPPLPPGVQRVVKETNCGEPGRAYDDDRLCELLDLQQECISAFDACVQRERATARRGAKSDAVLHNRKAD